MVGKSGTGQINAERSLPAAISAQGVSKVFGEGKNRVLAVIRVLDRITESVMAEQDRRSEKF